MGTLQNCTLQQQQSVPFCSLVAGIMADLFGGSRGWSAGFQRKVAPNLSQIDISAFPGLVAGRRASLNNAD
jgi:hypothetical protein